jgi:hypothetical protein
MKCRKFPLFFLASPLPAMTSPRFSNSERLALILLLGAVAATAGWRWWSLQRAGEESLRNLPAARSPVATDALPESRHK